MRCVLWNEAGWLRRRWRSPPPNHQPVDTLCHNNEVRLQQALARSFPELLVFKTKVPGASQGILPEAMNPNEMKGCFLKTLNGHLQIRSKMELIPRVLAQHGVLDGKFCFVID